VILCYAIPADSVEGWGAEKKDYGFEEVEGLGGCGQGLDGVARSLEVVWLRAG